MKNLLLFLAMLFLAGCAYCQTATLGSLRPTDNVVTSQAAVTEQLAGRSNAWDAAAAHTVRVDNPHATTLQQVVTAGSTAQGDVAFATGSSDEFRAGYAAGIGADGDNGTFIGPYSGFLSSTDESVHIGRYSGSSASGGKSLYFGNYAGKSSVGDYWLFIDSYASVPSATEKGTNDNIVINGNTGEMWLGRNGGTTTLRGTVVIPGLTAVTNGQTSVTLNTIQPPNGFERQSAQTVSFDPATRKAVVTPSGASFRVTAGGITYQYANAVTSSAGPAASGGLYAYFRPSDGAFVCTNVPWAIDGEAQAIFAQYDHDNVSSVFTVDERHGVNISDEDHLMRHKTVGTVWASGITISHFGNDTATAAGASGTNTCIAITDSGEYWDEDIKHLSVANGSNGGSTTTAGVFPVLWKDGSTWRKRAGTAFPFLWSGNIPSYVNSSGVETAVSEDQYFVYWLIAVGSADGTNLFLVSHPSVFTSTALAQSGATFQSLVTAIGGLPNNEMLVCYRMIFQFNASGGGANPVAVKSAKLRAVDDYRNVPSGVILSGVGAGSGNYDLTAAKIEAAGGALQTNLDLHTTAALAAGAHPDSAAVVASVTSNTAQIASNASPYQPWTATLTPPPSGGTNVLKFSDGALPYLACTGAQTVAWIDGNSNGWGTNGLNRQRLAIWKGSQSVTIQSNASVVWASAISLSTTKTNHIIASLTIGPNYTNVVLYPLTAQ